MHIISLSSCFFLRYLTPKSSITKEKLTGINLCLHSLGVFQNCQYSCGARFLVRKSFAIRLACGRPYINFLISEYTCSFFSIDTRFYCVVISSGMILIGKRIYSYRSMGVPGFKKIDVAAYEERLWGWNSTVE